MVELFRDKILEPTPASQLTLVGVVVALTSRGRNCMNNIHRGEQVT